MSTTSGPDRKPVRRVRVIEILDDDLGEDLDEATIDAALAAADAARSVEDAAAAEAEAGDLEDAEPTASDLEDADEEPAGEPVPARRPSADKPVPSGASGRVTASLTAAVVALALLAGFALVQWRSAAGAAEDRKALIARVTAFGDVMATYSYDDVESANKKAMAYLTGDALEERKKVDLAALSEQLKSQKTKLTSKTYAVYVGSVDGNLATAVLVFDLEGESSALSGPQTISKSHLTLGLIKRDGEWMISSMVPAGTEGANSSAASTLPSSSTAPSPSPSEKE